MDISQTRWRKSTHSQQGGACIEVADGFAGVVPVRDSKDPNGSALVFSAAAFGAFIESVRAGEFGLV
ncbi:DUF397 domain-containing protein [Kitasatospora viridis]|uniref:Uncharacterized protein DUF397 n=1 Tax=Kitasatospora viridis TaxID=281105 RepID=A0A561UBU4_9ACTN|nr:DUF397 domain-containing protein [Kitasatospora viridis]TWF96825.1 uncharacterized protein DUF397 [Kitasatospora viridis]